MMELIDRPAYLNQLIQNKDVESILPAPMPACFPRNFLRCFPADQETLQK